MREPPRFSVRLFAWIARRLLPEDFRRQLEAPLVDAFEDRMDETKGRADGAAVFLRELSSLIATAARERWREFGDAGRRASGEKFMLASVLSDLRIGARGLQRRQGFGIVGITALALGIGLNTALFGLADSVFLRPLPYPEADRLTVISMELAPAGTDGGFSASYLDLRDLGEENRSFDALALFLDWQSVNLAGSESPERVAVNFATANYFALLGFEPFLGRLFREESRLETPHPVAVLSHAAWQRSFGGAADVVGQRVLLNGWPFEVVGVLSPGTSDLGERFREKTGVYLPLSWARSLAQLDLESRRSARYVYGLARLRPSVSLAEARRDAGEISARLEKSYPDTKKSPLN